MRVSPSTAPVLFGPSRNRVFCDFLGGISANGTGDLTLVTSGAGAGNVLVAADVGRPGIQAVVMGTTATGQAHIGGKQTSLRLGGGPLEFAAAVRVPVLSDGTNRFGAFLGLYDSVTAFPGNGIFLYYKDDVNGGRWQLNIVAGSVTQMLVDTGVAVAAGAWATFRMSLSAANVVAASLNGVSLGSVFTGFPLGVGLFWGLNARKTVGTTSRNVDCDYLLLDYTVNGRI